MQSYLILYSVSQDKSGIQIFVQIFSTNWKIKFFITIYRWEAQNLEKLSDLPQIAPGVKFKFKSDLSESNVQYFPLIVTVAY